MKNIPNILTLGNLFCGCIAITMALTAPPHLISTNGGADYFPIMGSVQLLWTSVFILFAALFDVFDGMAARMLKVESAIGKDLDSLADVVSFGVAPATILYQMLWMATMSEPKAMEANYFIAYLAFLLPCFGALRLARFNQNSKAQSSFFMGMPIPAAGITVAILPLAIFLNKGILTEQSSLIAGWIQNKWFLIGLTLLLSYLMVSKSFFLKWKAPVPGMTGWWAHLIIVIVAIITYILFGFVGLLMTMFVYMIVSKLYPYPEVKTI
ncbi:MAG TPA: CDP-alcohol phosphatidyltransferase family protein [Edaphocola sp.]|nr:CDP-alcohol phosphatidyltransferase family protein [Edaphocola sp.]